MSSKGKNNSGDEQKHGKIIADPRFAAAHTDPRFRNVRKQKTNVEIDSRFKQMFSNPNSASSKATTDKIELASESDSDCEMESSKSGAEVDYSTDDDEEEQVDEDDNEYAFEENVPQIDKETHRLAVMNFDWRYVKEEEVHGPVGLFDGDGDGDGDGDDDGVDIDIEKSWQYELMECDSSATADHLYKNCDGVESERSASVLDLRFIPDSTEFKHPPRDVATEAPANYKGLEFETRALQQSKVHLSWDEDEPDRVKTLKRKFTEDQGKEVPVESKIPTADFEDSRFSSFFTSPLFALDPNHPQFKRYNVLYIS
ncbi:hypothetical protein ACFE04_030755 [Oxalis oulophora]